jgi:chromosome partitioning protein
MDFSLPFGNDWRTKELSEALGVPIFDTQIVDREAFRAMFSFGGSLAGLAYKGGSGLPAALVNAHAFTQELVDRLRNGVKSVSEAA